MRIFAVLLSIVFPTVGWSAEVIDDFQGSALNAKVWDTCQIQKGLVHVGQHGPGRDLRSAVQFDMKEDTGNKDTCKKPGEVQPLLEVDPGPSLVVTPPSDAKEKCESGDPDRKQRNEIRFFENGPNWHDWTDPHWYSLTFNVAGVDFHCGSARWIAGQWKQTTGNAESPIFAQRFDNGVFHLSVQDGVCRCMVAKASGNPDRLTTFLKSTRKTGRAADLMTIKPLKCIRTDLPDNAKEKKCKPHGMLVQGFSSVPPELPDPTKGWVTMTYHISGGANGLIDVFADGNFVVRVKGQIGYPLQKNEEMGSMKFKVGHYRDWVPSDVELDVDRLCMSKSAASCDPKVKPLK